MAKKTKDLKPDTVLKNYWNNNEQFADLFNAVLFEGKPGAYSLCNAYAGYGV